MGLSNFLGSNEEKIAKLKGELKRKCDKVKTIQEGVVQLPQLHDEIKALEKRIEAGIAFVKPDYPDWEPAKIKPHETRSWKSPFEIGEAGRTALGVLRREDRWMTVREITKEMLKDIGHDSEDRATVDKLTKTVGNYLRKKVGDLIESQGEQPVRYKLIRQFED